MEGYLKKSFSIPLTKISLLFEQFVFIRAIEMLFESPSHLLFSEDVMRMKGHGTEFQSYPSRPLLPTPPHSHNACIEMEKEERSGEEYFGSNNGDLLASLPISNLRQYLPKHPPHKLILRAT